MIVSRNKYGAVKITVDGIRFDSRKEARRYTELKLLPAQYAHTDAAYTRGARKGQPKRGRCIEQAVVYVADFVYTENGRTVVEDTKGLRTKDYIIKRKLFRYRYGAEYDFREI